MTNALEESTNDKDTSSILLERASVYEALGQSALSRDDVKLALKKDPSNAKAKEVLDCFSKEPSSKGSIPKDPRVDAFQDFLERISDPTKTAEIKQFSSSPDFVRVLTACGEEDTPAEVRAAAYMLLTKLLNPGPNATQYPMPFIIEQCAKCFSHCMNTGKNADKLLAFRTLNALFQTNMTVGAAIFAQEGVVEEIMDIIEFEVVDVQIAIANVLAIASSDSSCQKVIVKYGSSWLAKTASLSSTDVRLKAIIGTTLTKLQAQGASATAQKTSGSTEPKDESLEDAMRHMNLNRSDLTESMKNVVKDQVQDGSIVLNAVEGLAYSSLESSVKESLINDGKFMKSLVAVAINAANTNSNPLLFGIGTILANITMYRPVLDEQQQQMKKLRDLANAKSTKKAVPADDPLETDKAVEARIKLSVEHSAPLALMVMAKSTSNNIRMVAAQTYHNIITPQATRGKLLQQGIVKSLLPLAVSQKDPQCAAIASQALAKLAITTDPRLAFGPEHSLDLLRPFLNLCKDDGNQLRQFEGLMALTNLASVYDNCRYAIFQEQGLGVFENLQLSNNTMVQRAATEMVCNMTFCDPVFDLYSDPNKPGTQNKIRLLMILSDHDDEGTRRAASGALAILSNAKGTCEMMARIDKGYERISRLMNEDEIVDVKHRGIEIVRCMVMHLEKDAITPLVTEGVDEKLVNIVKTCQTNVVRSAAMDVLKLMVTHGAQLKS
ncbi:armadillo-type protein [Phycomyces nitens]|nr:armadillo-type protein [Phycomyces nitens]